MKRKGRLTKAEHQDKKARMYRLMDVNPYLSISDYARHVDVTPTTASRWIEQRGWKRWAC